MLVWGSLITVHHPPHFSLDKNILVVDGGRPLLLAALKKTMVPKIDAARKRITSSQTLVPKNET